MSARIAVFRALQLGDMLCAVPALSALRSAFPKSTITLIGLPWAEAFVKRYPMLVDELVVFPGAPGFPEQTEEGSRLSAFIGAARERHYELAIQMHGSGGVANDIVAALGARLCAGFLQPGEARDGSFLAWPDHVPEAERYLALMRHIGIEARDPRLWFPLHADDLAGRDRLVQGIDLKNAVVVHAGAQLPSRRWPTERFAAVADALDRAGYDVLLTGTASEAPLVRETKRWMRQPAIDVCGRTTLGSLAALISRVRLVLCNDTGVSHLAAALGTPSVVVASGSDTGRWAPLNRSLHRVLASYPPCRPCAHRVCPTGHECARAISISQVVTAIREQLACRRRSGTGHAR